MVEMDSSRAKDAAYFSRLYGHMDTEAFRTNWFKFLMNRDLTNFNR